MKPRRSPKPRPETRAELLARERDAWHELNATWRGLSARTRTQPGASGKEWSVTGEHIYEMTRLRKRVAK